MRSVERVPFVAFGLSAAIWVAGPGLVLGIHPVVVLPTLAFLLVGAAAVAHPRTRLGPTVLAVWACAAVAIGLLARPVTGGGAAWLSIGIMGASLLVGAWAVTGILLLNAKDGSGPRP